ncbi:MAG: hypothetical protein RL318_2947, partial [Fibrobacterota bacterium]
TNTYATSSLATGDVITVRAASEMGGLGASSNALTIGTTTSVSTQGLGPVRYGYDSKTRTLRFSGELSGRMDVSLHRLDGSLVQEWTLESDRPGNVHEISLRGLASGSYALRYRNAGAMHSGTLDLR